MTSAWVAAGVLSNRTECRRSISIRQSLVQWRSSKRLSSTSKVVQPCGEKRQRHQAVDLRRRHTPPPSLITQDAARRWHWEREKSSCRGHFSLENELRKAAKAASHHTMMVQPSHIITRPQMHLSARGDPIKTVSWLTLESTSSAQRHIILGHYRQKTRQKSST